MNSIQLGDNYSEPEAPDAYQAFYHNDCETIEQRCEVSEMLSELSYLYDIMDLHVLHLTVEDSDFLKPSNFDFVCSTTQVQSEVLSDLALKNP